MRGLTGVLATALAMHACVEAHAAGGAYVVDDAAVDDPFACKIETSASFASNTTFVGQLTPACVLPLFRPTEIGVNVVRARTPVGDWGTALLAKAKINLLPVETGKIGVAVSGGSAFNLLTGDYAGSFFNVPVTYTVSDSFRLNANFGWIYERENDRHAAAFGAGAEWIPAKPFTLIAEVFWVLSSNPETRTDLDPRFQAGIRITPIETMDFDVIYGRNILGENANWITVGWNVRFPPPKN